MKIYTVTTKPYLLKRAIATIIDYGIYLMFFVAYVYVFDEGTDVNKMEVHGWRASLLILFWLLYFVVFESANSATPGHDIMKLKVFKTDGRRPNWVEILKRRLLDPVDIFFYGIPGAICISKTPKNQRIGDLWADTIVVKTSDITETDYTF